MPDDPLAQPDAEAAEVEAQLQSLERFGIAADEPAALRARRRAEEGEQQYLLGDWLHAAVLLTNAVDEPTFGDAHDRPAALFRLADALRRQGLCGAARARYAEYLALGDAEHRRDALSGGLECAVKERRQGDVDRLLGDSEHAFGSDVPPDVRYLAAKAIFQRKDLPSAERIARARTAFEKVGPPFQLQAWYFEGVLDIQQENLRGSLQWFERCARTEPHDDARAREVRDLCRLALARVHAQMGDPVAAIDWYKSVPWSSPYFSEALLEQAWAHVRAKRFAQALAVASFITDLEPDSRLAPEATILQGHLLLRLGRHAAATEAYNIVINSYGPVRDEIDAILSMHEDPVRYFNELIGTQGKNFDVASVLPPVAAKWASDNEEVSAALELVRALDDARREVQEAQDRARRLESLLQRGGGADAFPALQRAYAQAEAVENAAARTEAKYVEALAHRSDGALSARSEDLGRARRARKAIEARFEALPRTPAQIESRLVRMRGRIQATERQIFKLKFAIAGCTAAITGMEAWMEQHRSEGDADVEARQELADELRKHREIVEGYEADLAALREDVAKVRDTAGAVDAIGDESRIRAEYLAAVEREHGALEALRGSGSPADRAVFERVQGARRRLGAIRAQARTIELAVASEAKRRAAELRARLGEEKTALAEHNAALDGVQAASKEILGRVAARSIRDVRAEFYQLVLKADVGIVDVAWSQKRQRLEKIQTLAAQQQADLEELDRAYRSLLHEVD